MGKVKENRTGSTKFFSSRLIRETAKVFLVLALFAASCWGEALNAEYPVKDYPECTTLGDFNADGKLDMAVASDWGIGVLLNLGDGSFGTRTDYAAGDYPSFIVTADIEGMEIWILSWPTPKNRP